jgi:hypothetical protein
MEPSIRESPFKKQAEEYVLDWFSKCTYSSFPRKDYINMINKFIEAMEAVEEQTKESVNDWFEAPEWD